MTLLEMKQAVKGGKYDENFAYLYGDDEVLSARDRYLSAIDEFIDFFGYSDGEFYAFSAPGRTELCGNHTDHNFGKVLAGAVNIDVIAIVCKTDSDKIRVKSAGHRVNEININELEPIKSEEGNSNSILRGMTARIKELGYGIGTFDAYTVSNVPAGSGLSSSAAFECLLGCIQSELYGGGAIDKHNDKKYKKYDNLCIG